MQIEITESENKNLVILSGELVGVDSVRLSKTLEQFKTSELDEVIIDLSKVKYMDSNCFGSELFSKVVYENLKRGVVS